MNPRVKTTFLPIIILIIPFFSRSILESVYIHDDTTRFNSQTQLFKDWLKAAKFPVFGKLDLFILYSFACYINFNVDIKHK